MVTLPSGIKVPLKKLRICRDFAQGKCTRSKCLFPHVSGLPASLQEKALSKDGLTLCSLCLDGASPAEDGTYSFDSAKERQVLASINAATAGKEAMAGSLSECSWDIEGMDNVTLQAIASGEHPFAGQED